MIWYSPELDEFVILGVCEFNWENGETPFVRFNIENHFGLNDEIMMSVAWFLIGNL
jgi:hypothetical protein